MKLVDKLTSDIFKQCLRHFEKEENKLQIHEQIIDPVIMYISEQITIRIYSYFLFLNIILILITILLLVTLFLLIKK